MPDRIYVNKERTVLVTVWASGTVTVATRTHPAETWGPPVLVEEEQMMFATDAQINNSFDAYR